MDNYNPINYKLLKKFNLETTMLRHAEVLCLKIKRVDKIKDQVKSAEKFIDSFERQQNEDIQLLHDIDDAKTKLLKILKFIHSKRGLITDEENKSFKKTIFMEMKIVGKKVAYKEDSGINAWNLVNLGLQAVTERLNEQKKFVEKTILILDKEKKALAAAEVALARKKKQLAKCFKKLTFEMLNYVSD